MKKWKNIVTKLTNNKKIFWKNKEQKTGYGRNYYRNISDGENKQKIEFCRNYFKKLNTE